MALIRTTTGIIDISGSMAGNTFAKDRYGHHIRAKARRVRQRTQAQLTQRRAFIRARNYSKDNRIVSYNIYRALNNLEMATPPPDYEIQHL